MNKLKQKIMIITVAFLMAISLLPKPINVQAEDALTPLENVVEENEEAHDLTNDDQELIEDVSEEEVIPKESTIEDSSIEEVVKETKVSDEFKTSLLTWEEVQDKIDSAREDEIIDFSDLNDPLVPQVLKVDNKKITFTNINVKDLKVSLSNNASLTLNNVSISNSDDVIFESLDSTNNTLIIKDTISLQAPLNNAGISVANHKRLSILGDGNLNISSTDGAGIGGSVGEASGIIVIGDEVTVQIDSNGYGAGIGGGMSPQNNDNESILITDNAKITINNTGKGGTGIGGGHNEGALEPGSSSGNITISGNSKVNVHASKNVENAAGIGTGEGGRLGK